MSWTLGEPWLTQRLKRVTARAGGAGRFGTRSASRGVPGGPRGQRFEKRATKRLQPLYECAQSRGWLRITRIGAGVMTDDDRFSGGPLARRSARELTLELQRLRKEASAARLEAQAAAIELILARMREGSPETSPQPDGSGVLPPERAGTDDRPADSAETPPDSVDPAGPSDPGGRSAPGAVSRSGMPNGRGVPVSPDRPIPERPAPDTPLAAAVGGEESAVPLPPPGPAVETPAFRDWDEVRRVLVASDTEEPGGFGTIGPSGATDPGRPTRERGRGEREIRGDQRPATPKPESAAEPRRPDERAFVDARKRSDAGRRSDARKRSDAGKRSDARKRSDAGLSVDVGGRSDVHAAADVGEFRGHCEVSGDGQTTPRRRRPVAWLVSAAVHLLILILLAGWTLTVHAPLDQVALAASHATSEESPMETFTIETTEPASDTAEETPTEPEVETSPVGELDWNPSRFDVTAPPAVAGFDDSGVATVLAGGPASGGEASMAFCGVEGGGQHFVYLVDSSGSMGSAFESARLELIRSVSMLAPDQRFYVVFFDEEPDYMRLSDPQRDEPHSVFATPENKQRLARWAMTIRMDRGRAPYEPLRFALGLRPDVIFMLSDGEFPQRIEDQLREENRLENLFGDTGPISIIHTIGYHSREGEARMRRIAEQNGGQYRYVPKPDGGRRPR